MKSKSNRYCLFCYLAIALVGMSVVAYANASTGGATNNAVSIFGNVGIGTTQPEAPLHVFSSDLGMIIGDTTNAPRLFAGRDSAHGSLTVQPYGGNAAGSVEIFPSGATTRSHFLAANANDPNNFGFIELEANGNQGWLDAAAKGTGVAPTLFRFKGFFDGVRFQDDVVVGQNQAPASTFHIVKYNKADAYDPAATDGQLSEGVTLFMENTRNANTFAQIVMQPRGSAKYNRIVSSGSFNPYLSFVTGDTEAMRILDTGNVGIGTATPEANLDVSGDIKVGSSGVICDASAEGNIRYNGVVHQGCDGSTWNDLY